MEEYKVYEYGFGGTVIGYVDETGAVYKYNRMIGKVTYNLIYDGFGSFSSVIGCISNNCVYKGSSAYGDIVACISGDTVYRGSDSIYGTPLVRFDSGPYSARAAVLISDVLNQPVIKPVEKPVKTTDEEHYSGGSSGGYGYKGGGRSSSSEGIGVVVAVILAVAAFIAGVIYLFPLIKDFLNQHSSRYSILSLAVSALAALSVFIMAIAEEQEDGIVVGIIGAALTFPAVKHFLWSTQPQAQFYSNMLYEYLRVYATRAPGIILVLYNTIFPIMMFLIYMVPFIILAIALRIITRIAIMDDLQKKYETLLKVVVIICVVVFYFIMFALNARSMFVIGVNTLYLLLALGIVLKIIGWIL